MKKGTVGLALTWDGARWPTSRLSLRARAFLTPSRPSAQMAVTLCEGEIEEIRICWVPRVKGGHPVLCDPFFTADGLRISFRMVRTVRFGDVLGVVYRRAKAGR
jgi:hypothetical protein